MAKIPSRKFSTTKKKIASRGFSKAKVKIASRGFAKVTAKIPSRKLSASPKAVKKPVASVLLERPADETTRQERLAALKAEAKLTPASDLQSPS
jgi:hypothetical protein